MDNNWQLKISNHNQLGGIEISTLDNGAGRGTRIAWVNTGTGLRYKIIIDRAMDIADAFYNQHSLAWLSHTGIKPPQPFSNKGLDWLKTFGGGLLTTCGLTHTGGPEQDEFGERGLHGEISNIPAEIIAIDQPDPTRGKFGMSITGIIRETRIFGHALELKRTISGTLGRPEIKITDEIVNRGNTPAPHMILYHFNFGWPFADEGSDIFWKGEWQPRDGEENAVIFKKGGHFQKCPPPLATHNGANEEVAIVDIAADENDNSVCGLYNRNLQLGLTLNWKKSQLPWFINWQHFAEGEYVTGLEPANIPGIGQSTARKEGKLEFIEPSGSKTYQLVLRVLTDTQHLEQLVAQHKAQ